MKKFDTVCPLKPGYRDYWRLYDGVTDFLAAPVRVDTFYGSSRGTLINGDMSLVAESTKMLEHFEQAACELLAPSRPMRPAVVGGAWDIPAVFAGVPLAARARVKATANTSPLTVLVDCGCSGGISNEQMNRRGACILALVRLLSRNRPVKLWIGETNVEAGTKNTRWDFMRVDTNPLDLARVAWMVTSTAFTRQCVWSVLVDTSAQWPMVVGRQLHGDEMAKCASVWAGETLCIEAAYLSDPLLNDPIAWLKDKLAKLT